MQERGWNVTLKVKKHSSGKSMEDKWENDCIGGQYRIKSLLLKAIKYLSKVVIG